VTRRRRGVEAAAPSVEMRLGLEFGFGPGPLIELDDEELAEGWRLYGDAIMEEWGRTHASRPWGWWVFEQGEDPPELAPGAKEIQLAELGELTAEEIEEIAERAVEARAVIESGIKSYVATGRGGPINFEQEAVDLWDRVQELLP
jgi:hypothetical protein